VEVLAIAGGIVIVLAENILLDLQDAAVADAMGMTVVLMVVMIVVVMVMVMVMVKRSLALNAHFALTAATGVTH
jgi:hypothetical protein